MESTLLSFMELVSVIIAGFATFFAWKAADAQSKATDSARVLQELETRPLLTVTDIKGLEKERIPNTNQDGYPVHVVFTNVGRAPARMKALDVTGDPGCRAAIAWPISYAAGSRSHVTVWLPHECMYEPSAPGFATKLELHYWDFQGNGFTTAAHLYLFYWKEGVRINTTMRVENELITPIPPHIREPDRVTQPGGQRFRPPTI